MLSTEVTSCLFFILLMLSFSLTVTDVSDEQETNKAFPITVLIVNSIIIFLVLLSVFGVRFASDIVKKSSLLLFVLVLILSFILSIVDVTDEDKENHSLPIIVLVVNSLVMLMVGYQLLSKYLPNKSMA